MAATKMLWVSDRTHDGFHREAQRRGTTIDEVAAAATIRGHRSEVTIEPDPGNGLDVASAAQCQHIRAIAVGRLTDPLGNVGLQALTQIARSPPTSSTTDHARHRGDGALRSGGPANGWLAR